MINLSIIIPCYNESRAIPDLIDICRSCANNRTDVEFIFVDNGSNDSSDKVLKDLLENKENHFARQISIKKNIGYGNGILRGLDAANGKILAWTHADLQTHPKDVILAYDKYYKSLINNTSIVKGNRVNRNIFDSFFTFGMSVFSSLILRKKLFDINAQPKIFNKLFYNDLEKPPIDFSLDLFLIYSALDKGLTVKTFPVVFNQRHSGESKGGGTIKGKIKLIMRTFKYIISLKKDLL